MLLVADVGNTHVHLGLFDGPRLVRTRTFPGERVLDLEAEWAAFVGTSEQPKVRNVVLCSVSPKTKIPFMHWAADRFGQRPHVVGDSIPYPMPVLLDDPSEVGSDRVVNAFGAWRELGRGPIVVADFGTAITLDIVTAEGAYLGGVIAPGVRTAARALADRTALLPLIRVQKTDTIIGRNTIDALRGGLYFGMQGMVEAMCRQVARELDAPPVFVATGGDAELICADSELLQDVRPHLTLEGLRLIWNAHRGTC